MNRCKRNRGSVTEVTLLHNHDQCLGNVNIASFTNLSFNKFNAIVTKCVDDLRYYRDSSPERKRG